MQAQTTFQTTFTRSDVREFLRAKCAKNFLKKMTEDDKEKMFSEAGVDKPKDDFKNSDWVKEIIGSWDRVETDYIPVSEMEVIVMKPEEVDALNQKFEKKEADRISKQEEKMAAKEEAKSEKEAAKALLILEKKAAKEAAKEEAKQAKLEAKEAEKQAKLEAKEAEKQAKLEAKEAEKQAKLDAKEAEKQAKLDAKKAEVEAKKEAKMAEKEAAKAEKLFEKAKIKTTKSVIRHIVLNLTDSDKRLMICDNLEFFSKELLENQEEGEILTLDEIVAKARTPLYKQFLFENQSFMDSMSYYNSAVGTVAQADNESVSSD